jgi:hypothetical protein
VLRAKERAPTPCSFVVFILDSHLNLLRSLGPRHVLITTPHLFSNGLFGMVYEHILGCFIPKDSSSRFSKLFQVVTVIAHGYILRLVALVLVANRLLALVKDSHMWVWTWVRCTLKINTPKKMGIMYGENGGTHLCQELHYKSISTWLMKTKYLLPMWWLLTQHERQRLWVSLVDQHVQ